MLGSRVLLCLCTMTCCLTMLPAAGNTILHFGPCRISVSMSEIRAGFTAIKTNVQARDSIRTLSILSHPHSLHRVQPSDKCCIVHKVFNFYMDKVFKHCQTENSYINRKISSIANSFLSIRRKLEHCRKAFNKNRKKNNVNTEKLMCVLIHCYGSDQNRPWVCPGELLSMEPDFRTTDGFSVCHDENKCLCRQESTERFKQILVNYEGLNVTSAAMKSLGELDILLDWMEKSP